MLLLWMGLACGPKAPPAPAPAIAPDPLAERPAVGAPAAWTPPTPAVLELAGGADLWVVPQPGLPLVSLRVIVPGGAATDPTGQAGLTVLADELLVHGAGDRDAAAFAAETERLALDLWVSTDDRDTTIGLDAHADRLDAGLALLADALLRPTFAADQVALVRDQQQAALAESYDDPRSVAAMVAWAEWYGAEHPLARPTLGLEADLAGLTADHLRESWTSRLVPERVTIVASGAVEPAALQAALDAHLGGWQPPAAPASLAVEPPAGVPDGDLSLRFVDVPGASQTTLRVHAPGWAASDPAAPVANLGVIALGGTFTSRLNRLLREEKGYTYGARARSSSGPDGGTLVITTAVQRDVTAPALRDLFGAVQDWAGGISPEEVAKAAGARRTSVLSSFSTRSGVADTMAGLVSKGLPPDALAAELQTLASTAKGDVDPVLTDLSARGSLVVVAGDLSVIQGSVEDTVPGDWSVASPPR